MNDDDDYKNVDRNYINDDDGDDKNDNDDDNGGDDDDHRSSLKKELLFLLRISMCPKQPFSSIDHIFWVDDISYNVYNYKQLQTMSIMMMMMELMMMA